MQLTLLRLSHAVDFLGDVLKIGLGESAGAQKLSLFTCPGVKIPLIKVRLGGHAADLTSCANSVTRQGGLL